MKKAVVLGAGGFIGGHLVSKLKDLGYWVRGVDIKYHEFKKTDADEFIIADLRNFISVNLLLAISAELINDFNVLKVYSFFSQSNNLLLF